MPTESDRDDLARIIFTAKYAGWKEWETASEGMRDWCRDTADDAMAAGWRKVRADQTVVSREVVLRVDGWIEDKLNFVTDPYQKQIYSNVHAELSAAMADPAGANGGE